jgi:microcystin-dependent protein
MADPFVAEIRILPYSFAPKGWAFCLGQLIPISQNTALFALLGTVYGGDGKSNFALPDLKGSAAMMPGDAGGGLSGRQLGEIGGTETETLLISEIPVHTHTLKTTSEDANDDDPGNAAWATSVGMPMYQSVSAGNLVTMAPQILPPAGGSLPHNNMQPYLAMNFCIAMQGVFPPRW